jgi:hypothetical protein
MHAAFQAFCSLKAAECWKLQVGLYLSQPAKATNRHPVLRLRHYCIKPSSR